MSNINVNYRKKPIVIQAFQLTFERNHSQSDWPEWLTKAWLKKNDEVGAMWRSVNGWPLINTLEGNHYVSQNDWIIRGVQGELYPCKPDIFKQTYEAVN